MTCIASCSGGGISPPAGSRPLGLQAVAVAGDTPFQFVANLAAAQSAKKSVRFVSIATPRGADRYSVYSRVVRTQDAIVVLAYGRMHAYPIAGTGVAYSGTTAPVSVTSLPQVNMPTLDGLIESGSSDGLSQGALSNLCGHCSIALLPRAGTKIRPTLWQKKQDPWQVNPDYVFWAPGTDAIASLRPDLIIGNNPCALSVEVCCPDGLTYCAPSFPFGSSGGGASNPQPIRTPAPTCNRLGSLSAKRAIATIPRTTDEDFQALTAAVARHSVADRDVDANIDPQIQGERRAFVREMMLTLPPWERQSVAGYDSTGKFFSNRAADYIEAAQTKPWVRLADSLWRDPDGEIVAIPKDLPSASQSRSPLSVGPCEPTGSSNTGAYVRGYSCGSAQRSFTTVNDARAVGGAVGPSWCFNTAAGTGDTGYTLVGAFGKYDSAEGGLQFSPIGPNNYGLYAKDAGTPPDPILHSMRYPPSLFSLTFTLTSTTWQVTVATTSLTQTWMHPTASSTAAGSSWTYKQETTIAQNGFFPTTGSYFGVNSAGAPLFVWNSTPYSDMFPGSPISLQVFNAYGINLQSI